MTTLPCKQLSQHAPFSLHCQVRMLGTVPKGYICSVSYWEHAAPVGDDYICSGLTSFQQMSLSPNIKMKITSSRHQIIASSPFTNMASLIPLMILHVFLSLYAIHLCPPIHHFPPSFSPSPSPRLWHQRQTVLGLLILLILLSIAYCIEGTHQKVTEY